VNRPFYDPTHPGWVVLTAVAVLCLVGLLCIYATESSSGVFPLNAVKQALYIAASAVAALVVLWFGYQRLGRHAYTIFIIVLLLLTPLLIAKLTHFDFGGFVPERRNAYRWIKVPGFQLQPSEFMKVACILALASYLRFRKNYRTFHGMLLPFVICAVPMGLILLEPDLGTVILMLPLPFVLLFMAGAKKRHLAVVLVSGLLAAPLVWNHIEGYQRMRIVGLLLQHEPLRQAIIAHPEKYAHLCSRRQAAEWEADSGMQMLRSKAALGSGGLLGEGWGHGTYVEYNFLPDRHNDFVFALVGHQWGLAGCLVVLGCYATIVVAGVEIAARTTDPVGRLLAVGVITLISAQVIINVGMTAGLMPITGMTLPFVSYGGSSMLTNFVAVGLLISVAQHRPFLLSKRPFEFPDEQEE
jgi:rod shape determining protein RodA